MTSATTNRLAQVNRNIAWLNTKIAEHAEAGNDRAVNMLQGSLTNAHALKARLEAGEDPAPPPAYSTAEPPDELALIEASWADAFAKVQ